MVDAPPDPPEDLDEELADYEDDLDDVDPEVRELVDDLRGTTDVSLRLAVRYSGDDSDLLFAREDIRERYTGPELEDRVEALVLMGLGDPPREESLDDFGSLEATLRWYDQVLVAHFPYREWSGLAFTFDRHGSPIVDLVGEHLS